MTLEEKVGQMTQITLAVVSKGTVNNPQTPQEIDTNKLKKAILQYHIGSILNVVNHAYSRKHWHQILHQIQSITNRTRLKIPVLYGIDAIHGSNYILGSTLFPQEIGQAATWNPALVKKAAEITAYETRAAGIPWVFSPVLGVGKQPLWPRLYETFGEDTYLTSKMAVAIVKGYEGIDIAGKYHVASCMKHYMGYSFPLSGKDRTPAWIPENYLRKYFLPPFSAAVEAGSHTLMINSSSINGVPVHADHHILTDILRNELHFKGLAVSDWGDIENLYTKYHFVRSEKEAVKVAVLAGVDMSMVPFDYSFPKYLIELVKEGQIPMSRINQAVKRILTVKEELGLFDDFVYPEKDYPKFGSAEFKTDNLKTAQESITLLKNNNQVLPLKKKHIKILVTGFAANSMATLNGGWTYTWQGTKTDFFDNKKTTILKAIQNKIGKENVFYSKGTNFNKPLDNSNITNLAKKADYIVLCLGEMPYAETPGNINDLYLPENQVNFALKLAKTGKPVILVLTEGRPRLISKFADKMSGIIMAYLPGNQGGNAIADVLFGDVNPSGKLPFTYPRFPNSLENYNITYDQQKIDTCPPQFPFGFGLSYTTFRYSKLRLNCDTLSKDKTLKISVNITNTGKRAGKEVVQLYIGDLYRNATILPDVKRLVGFSKINLLPGETKTVSFSIKKPDLSFVNRKMKTVTVSGTYKVQVGNLTRKFYLK
ncbi:glycoside hydrolase family 3 C-terminal domain-containing protein [Candidatus Sulfidibacterium hydrothermale]|uniref:glycoside hydrolase family 3 N-terminal domain-containing protein n=1 Tax=Candidatus Sulfidibacterium hydrothermale TaxID=2875962 RepID=UPI001F0B5D0D|nr:glycoside hydrolase family 3 N-terminal domain-containing protein [Candidatus Sulfidibacterium hydrothermale]UBM62519.1 glycoside hydrolase family 3 C-terminal domain-containing protein [Candidatus Sulfidibacterium hydrothermale]